jgi:SAM-dependent methyltransferase
MKRMLQILPKIEFSIQSLFSHQNYCPHCLSENLQLIAKKYALVKVKRCVDCKLCFTSPLYRTILVSQFYDIFYSAEGLTTDLPNSEALQILKEDGFKNSDKNFVERIRKIKEFTHGRNFLELGSSWGYLLYQASLEGFHVTGIEISDSRREFGRSRLNLNIVKSPDDLCDQKFDIIYTAHTLEHFADLSSIFFELNHLLEDNGKLFIEVPNFSPSENTLILKSVGAVHPLGMSSDFFSLNLPKYGFEIIGFYDSWNDFPDNSRMASAKEVIILAAQKVSSL